MIPEIARIMPERSAKCFLLFVMYAFRMPIVSPRKTWMTPIEMARISMGMIASPRFQEMPRRCTGSIHPMCSPKFPKNSPNRYPKMMVGTEEMISTRAMFPKKVFASTRCRTYSPMARMTSPYPISPTMSPKKMGKKIARTGEGSNSPYFGSATSPMMNSKGLIHAGLSYQTGACFMSSSVVPSSRTTTRSPNVSWRDCRMARRCFFGIQPMITKVYSESPKFA